MTERQPTSPDACSGEWFEEWFSNPLYLQAYTHRDAAEAALCVGTILRITGHEENPSRCIALDIACGAGRHAIELACRGIRVTANDLSGFLLDRARESAQEESLDIEFNRADMRVIDLGRRFNLIVQLFSSFGYFTSGEDDRAVVRNVSKMLLPGGWYVLDLLNPSYLKSHFSPLTERMAGALSIREERTLDDTHVRKTLTIVDSDGRHCTFTESVKLFGKEAICTLLAGEGLDVARIVGDYGGSAFDAETSPRLMVFAQKPLE